MKTYIFTCIYCNNIWIKAMYYAPDKYDLKCEKCGDKNVECKKYEKVDYYAKE